MEVENRILDKAGSLFASKGIRVVTMDCIARELGMSKRTIYENFEDKKSLIYALLTREMAMHREKLTQMVFDSGNVFEALFRFSKYKRDTFEKINQIFFDDLEKYYSKMFDEIKKTEKIGNGEIATLILNHGIKEGTLIKTIDTEIVVLFFHHNMSFFFRTKENEHFPHSKVWNSVFIPYLRGLCTNQGLRHFEQLLENDWIFTDLKKQKGTT